MEGEGVVIRGGVGTAVIAYEADGGAHSMTATRPRHYDGGGGSLGRSGADRDKPTKQLRQRGPIVVERDRICPYRGDFEFLPPHLVQGMWSVARYKRARFISLSAQPRLRRRRRQGGTTTGASSAADELRGGGAEDLVRSRFGGQRRPPEQRSHRRFLPFRPRQRRHGSAV